MSCISAFMSSSGLEGAAGLVEDAVAGMAQAVLGEVPNRQAARSDDGARVGLLEACQHLQERRLAGTVWSAESDALAIADLPRHVIDELPVSERLGEVRKLNQGSVGAGGTSA